jgi:hypothetical protein
MKSDILLTFRLPGLFRLSDFPLSYYKTIFENCYANALPTKKTMEVFTDRLRGGYCMRIIVLYQVPRAEYSPVGTYPRADMGTEHETGTGIGR